MRSIEIDQNFEDPIKNLYLLYLKKKSFKELLFYAKKLVEINSSNIEYNYNLAYAYDLNNNLSEALRYYQKYIDLNGRNKKQAFNNIGCMYLKKNKPKIVMIFF